MSRQLDQRRNQAGDFGEHPPLAPVWRADIEEARRLERKRLPQDVDYSAIQGLRLEAGEKLNKVKPENIGQAGRISGVSPADISVLLIWLASKEREGERA